MALHHHKHDYKICKEWWLYSEDTLSGCWVLWFRPLGKNGLRSLGDKLGWANSGLVHLSIERFEDFTESLFWTFNFRKILSLYHLAKNSVDFLFRQLRWQESWEESSFREFFFCQVGPFEFSILNSNLFLYWTKDIRTSVDSGSEGMTDSPINRFADDLLDLIGWNELCLLFIRRVYLG